MNYETYTHWTHQSGSFSFLRTCRNRHVILFNFLGVHHKTIPKYEQLPANVGDIVVTAISVNSGYTSRVLVSLIIIIPEYWWVLDKPYSKFRIVSTVLFSINTWNDVSEYIRAYSYAVCWHQQSTNCYNITVKLFIRHVLMQIMTSTHVTLWQRFSQRIRTFKEYEHYKL